jgi:hypothetical protein
MLTVSATFYSTVESVSVKSYKQECCIICHLIIVVMVIMNVELGDGTG